MFRAEVIQVIRTTLAIRGKGVEGDPIRRVTQYWSLDGKLLWEVDPYANAVERDKDFRRLHNYPPDSFIPVK